MKQQPFFLLLVICTLWSACLEQNASFGMEFTVEIPNVQFNTTQFEKMINLMNATTSQTFQAVQDVIDATEENVNHTLVSLESISAFVVNRMGWHLHQDVKTITNSLDANMERTINVVQKNMDSMQSMLDMWNKQTVQTISKAVADGIEVSNRAVFLGGTAVIVGSFLLGAIQLLSRLMPRTGHIQRMQLVLSNYVRVFFVPSSVLFLFGVGLFVLEYFDKVFSVFDVFAKVLLVLLFVQTLFCELMMVLSLIEQVDYSIYRSQEVPTEELEPLNYSKQSTVKSQCNRFCLHFARLCCAGIGMCIFVGCTIPLVYLKNACLARYS